MLNITYEEVRKEQRMQMLRHIFHLIFS